MFAGGRNDETVHKIYIYHINDISAVICDTHDSYRQRPGTSYYGIDIIGGKPYIKADSAIDYITGQSADIRVIQFYCECLDDYDRRPLCDKY